MSLVYLLGAVMLLGGLIWAFRAIYNVGKSKGRQDGIDVATKENDENFKDLADDVLDGGHPWGVLKPGATEVAYPELDSGVRVAPDVQGDGASGPRRNGANTS